MDSATPWQFSVIQNLFKGWEEIKCIICSSQNPNLTFKFDNLRIKQFPQPSVNNCGWKKVRHMPISNKWHSAIDRLAGTAVYGDP